jgi:IclR family KDG regulon transcriptional repressor
METTEPAGNPQMTFDTRPDSQIICYAGGKNAMQSTTRSLTILTTLARHPEGVGVSELAAEVDLPASSLHRALRSLLSHEWVWQDPDTRRYSLGVGLLELSSPLIEIGLKRLHQQAHGLLADLSQRAHADSFLSVLMQDKVLSLESVVRADNCRVEVTIYSGQRVPLHCGASAKAILAYMPSPHLSRMIERYSFRPYTMNTIFSIDEFLGNLALVRDEGYALCNQEYQVGVTAIAVPLFDLDGIPFASFGVCAASQRFDGKFRKVVTKYLQESAQSFSPV